MGWSFSDSLAFAAIMTLHDLSRENYSRRIKTQKFYQECYEKIAEDSSRVLTVVERVAKKASRRYMPPDLLTGCTYFPIYCFSLVIERQGRVTSEQNKMLKMFFDHLRYPFSQFAYVDAVRHGAEIGRFREIMTLNSYQAGEFWLNFFRALYKSGTHKDLQEVVDAATSMIMRFSLLGNPNSNLSEGICRTFVDNVNYQITQAREISIKDIDWLGVIPIPDRIEEMRRFYETLIDNSNITQDMSKEELIPLLDYLILNSICDFVMMTRHPKSIKLRMINDAVALAKIQTDVTPEEYINHIAQCTETGVFYKKMFSAGPPLGSTWGIITVMGSQTNMVTEAIGVTNDMLSILLQIENYLDEKYNFLGEESVAKIYMEHVIKQIMAFIQQGG